MELRACAWRRARTAVSCSFVDAVNSPRHMERSELHATANTRNYLHDLDCWRITRSEEENPNGCCGRWEEKVGGLSSQSHWKPSNLGKRGAQPSRGLKIRN
jgi:hypothetical protein